MTRDDHIDFDSDRNEDPNREEQLDDSFEAWYQNIGETVQRKLELTNVPKDSVFDAAVQVEEEPNE